MRRMACQARPAGPTRGEAGASPAAGQRAAFDAFQGDVWSPFMLIHLENLHEGCAGGGGLSLGSPLRLGVVRAASLSATRRRNRYCEAL